MNPLKAYLAIAYTLFFWGISFISTKICLGALSVYTLIFGRFFIAAVLLGILRHYLSPETRLLKEDLPRILIAGFIGFTGYYIFEALGIDLTGAAMASILLSLVPIFCMVADGFIFHKKLTLLGAFSVFLSVFGVAMIVGLSEVQINPWGCAAMLLSSAGWLLYNYLAKPLYARYTSLDISFYLSVCIAGVTLPLAFLNPPDVALLTPVVILNFLFLAVLVSATANLAYLYALKYLSMLTVSILVNFVPVITIIFSAIFLGESFTFLQLMGSALVILSVCLISIPIPAKK